LEEVLHRPETERDRPIIIVEWVVEVVQVAVAASHTRDKNHGTRPIGATFHPCINRFTHAIARVRGVPSFPFRKTGPTSTTATTIMQDGAQVQALVPTIMLMLAMAVHMLHPHCLDQWSPTTITIVTIILVLVVTITTITTSDHSLILKHRK
jgi:hypothetical protein